MAVRAAEKITAGRRSAADDAGDGRVAEVERDEVGRLPRSERSAGKAERAHPAGGGDAEEPGGQRVHPAVAGRGREQPALPAQEAQVALERPRLLEEVQLDVGVAPQRQGRAGPQELVGRHHPVAQVALGGGAGAHGGAAPAQLVHVPGGEVDGVDRGGSGPERADVPEQLHRREAVLGAALLHLGRLLGDVHVEWPAATGGLGGEHPEPSGRAGAHAVRGETHGHGRIARPRAGPAGARSRRPPPGNRRRSAAAPGREEHPPRRARRRSRSSAIRSPTSRAARTTSRASSSGSP